ncbi:hypothetical protein ARMSODRAFT_900264, partial [Armillaria solidipes]
MAWGLANLWKQGKEGGYSVRHGRKPRDGGADNLDSGPEEANVKPNFFEKAFPFLFPYGRGGLEDDRPTTLDFREHIRWCLRYHDRRFRKHETFPFVAFGIAQRQETLSSARLQMRRKTFNADAQIMASITEEMLEHAQQQEEDKVPITDPAIQLLRSHVHTSSGRIMGSDASRYRLRSQIWSTSLYMNPPSLWVTINPCDLHDPIAQVFAGEDIDLDNFISSAGPDKDQRAQNIANDPYAAAKFFHFMIRTILRTLFGVEASDYMVKSHPGIFGRVRAYFGTVE